MTDKPVFDKRLVLPDKFIHLSKTRVWNALGPPWGTLMPSPLGRDKIANAQPAGVTSRANAPRFPGGGVGWAPLELTDALYLKEYHAGQLVGRGLERRKSHPARLVSLALEPYYPGVYRM